MSVPPGPDPFGPEASASGIPPFGPPSDAVPPPQFGPPPAYGAQQPGPQPYGAPYGAPQLGPPPGYGPPSAWPYSSPYGYMPPPKGTSGLAIATLVTGICGFLYAVPALVAIGLGIAALRDINRSGRPGKGMAIGGLCAAGVWILIWILAIVAIVVSIHDASVNGDLSN